MTTTLKQQLLSLQKGHAEELPAKIDALEEAWKTVQTERHNFDVLREFYRQLHRLTGSGKTFGYPAVSAGAQGIERVIEDVLTRGAILGAASNKKIARFLELLHRASRRQPGEDKLDDEHDGLYRLMGERKSVLVVDDDPDFRRMLKSKLEMIGFRVTSAFDGVEGFAKVLSELPDLIITDYIMPNANGENLLNNVRANLATAHIPAIVITAQKVQGRKDYALEREMTGRCGASAYLEKPFEMNSLMNQVERVFAPAA